LYLHNYISNHGKVLTGLFILLLSPLLANLQPDLLNMRSKTSVMQDAPNASWFGIKNTGLIPADTTDVPNADSIVTKMTLREKIGQLFFIRANGKFINRESEYFYDLKQKIAEYNIGGVTFFRGDIYDQAILTNELQQMSKLPLWITQDMEYGAAMRINNTTRFTPNMGVAATQNPTYAYQIGRITALEAKALGVHQIFAPVLDINNNPDNPVINVRSYGSTPDIVSRFGLQFIAGVESAGIVPTAKHFPGHGDTDTDSHADLPVINHSFSRLDTVEFIPFRQAIENNVPSIMTAHIALPEISGNELLPSTLDGRILNHVLTDSLRFKGLIVTDALEMKGISSYYSPGKAVIKSLKAGAHVMLLSPDLGTAVEEVYKAVKNGVLPEEIIDEAVTHIIKLKIDHGLFENRLTNIDELDKKIATTEHHIVAGKIARQSITLLKNEGEILPITADRFPRIMVLSIADDKSGTTGSYLARSIRRYHPKVTFRVYDHRSGNHEKMQILRDARKADLIIFGSFIFVQTGKNIQLNNSQLDFIKKVINLSKPTVLAAYGNPYVVKDIPDTDAHIMAWSSNPTQIEASVSAMFGASEVSGKMPISIPDMYDIGDGISLEKTILRRDAPETAGLQRDSLRKINRLMNQAISDSVFPGGVVAIARNGIMAYEKSFGYHTYKKVQKIDTDAIYDLASLTKIMATTPAIMKLHDEGQLNINDKVGKYLPQFKTGGKEKLRIKNLLLHNSGHPPFKVYVDSLQTREEILTAARNEPLVAKPFEEYIYSDIGFMLLADIVEKVTNMRLDRYMRAEFYKPMDMVSAHFNPKKLGFWMSRRIPPTEVDTLFRKDTVQAVVHDERAFYMDGVAGHAGLFATAGDVASFGQMLLNKGSYAGQEFIKAETVEQFTTRQSNLNNRGYGFDRKSEGFSTAGTRTSMETFGHLGFTGTSLWIDPKNNLVIVVLTNRTYPYRSYGTSINKIRAEVADIAVSAIEK